MKHYYVSCPTCAARPGSPCQDGEGHPLPYSHLQRTQAADRHEAAIQKMIEKEIAANGPCTGKPPGDCCADPACPYCLLARRAMEKRLRPNWLFWVRFYIAYAFWGILVFLFSCVGLTKKNIDRIEAWAKRREEELRREEEAASKRDCP